MGFPGSVRNAETRKEVVFSAADEKDRTAWIPDEIRVWLALHNDPKDRFHFECNECIYARILGKRGLMKLGAMCCHADIINYGNLPFTDFIRTKTLCQGSDCCDFLFVRHDAESFERTKSI